MAFYPTLFNHFSLLGLKIVLIEMDLSFGAGSLQIMAMTRRHLTGERKFGSTVGIINIRPNPGYFLLLGASL